MKFVAHSINDEQKAHGATTCVDFHSVLQGQSTLSQLHHDWRHVLGLSLESSSLSPSS